ncbi:MAG: polysaccharide biosynthesis/export family protein [Acidobacteriaceae bacterium]|nr:polysaccharide biosynthesis/export family protein [Acidobacteriaceae bacterium]MBV8572517.1 polysaccharide biosynthesis/export family protein [Acidobacteriaceae bacterium]
MAPASSATAAQPPAATSTSASVLPPSSGALSLDYVLGPDDALAIHAYEMEDEIPERPVIVERDGTVLLPVLGKIKAEGLTVQQLEEALADRLKRYVRQPRVNIAIVRFRSEPIFVEGAFKAPGIYQLQEHRTLLDLITAIGLQPDASHTLRVTRRLEYGAIPLTSAVQQTGAKTTTADIDISAVKEGTNPVANLDLKPYDVITAKQAEMIYVLGDVTKSGPLEVGEHDSLSILQVLSMSGGTTPDAHLEKAFVLRPSLQTNKKTQIPVNVKRILAARDEDFALRPNDILYVPRKSGAGPFIQKLAYVALPMIPTFIYLFLR